MKHDILINRYNKLRDVGRLHCGINGQKKLEKRAIVVTYLKALQLDNIISLDQGISSANSIHFGTQIIENKHTISRIIKQMPDIYTEISLHISWEVLLHFTRMFLIFCVSAVVLGVLVNIYVY